MSKTWYTGIADNEGIESFEPMDEVDSHQTDIMNIRAHANPHRFAVVYKAELDDETTANVKRWLSEGNWLNGLRAMGQGIIDNKLNAEATNRKYWNLITKHSHTLTKITEGDE